MYNITKYKNSPAIPRATVDNTLRATPSPIISLILFMSFLDHSYITKFTTAI